MPVVLMPAVLGSLIFAALSATTGARAQSTPFSTGQSHYYESCGGCHGLDGLSARRQIPVLKSQVGTFLCSEEGRKYIVRLPNVSFAAMDDGTLAATMNFVIFELGRESVPKNARPYTAKEIGLLRRAPLKNESLIALRSQVLGRAVRACTNDAK